MYRSAHHNWKRNDIYTPDIMQYDATFRWLVKINAFANQAEYFGVAVIHNIWYTSESCFILHFHVSNYYQTNEKMFSAICSHDTYTLCRKIKLLIMLIMPFVSGVFSSFIKLAIVLSSWIFHTEVFCHIFFCSRCICVNILKPTKTLVTTVNNSISLSNFPLLCQSEHRIWYL